MLAVRHRCEFICGGHLGPLNRNDYASRSIQKRQRIEVGSVEHNLKLPGFELYRLQPEEQGCHSINSHWVIARPINRCNMDGTLSLQFSFSVDQINDLIMHLPMLYTFHRTYFYDTCLAENKQPPFGASLRSQRGSACDGSRRSGEKCFCLTVPWRRRHLRRAAIGPVGANPAIIGGGRQARAEVIHVELARNAYNSGQVCGVAAGRPWSSRARER